MAIHFKHTLGRVWQAYHAYWSTYSPVQSLASSHFLNFSFFILNHWPSYFTEQTSNQNTIPSSFLSVCQYFECHLLSAYYDELGMLSCNVKPSTWTLRVCNLILSNILADIVLAGPLPLSSSPFPSLFVSPRTFSLYSVISHTLG